jgi:glyceraldehyde 3-phosphate dehydrogenase
MARVAINGFGRIGRNVFRAYIEAAPKEWEIVAINDPFQNLEQSAHLLQFDSVLGEFKHNISVDGEFLVVDGKKVKFTAEKDPANCPWAKLEIDMVLECSGAFTDAEKSQSSHHSWRQESTYLCSC